MATQAATQYPTNAQLSYLRSLLLSTGMAAEENVDEAVHAWSETTRKAVSMLIDDLKANQAKQAKIAPKAPAVVPAPAAELPAGRYALETLGGDVTLYRIDRPVQGKWAGWTFVKDVTDGGETPIRGKDRDAVLVRIAEFGALVAAQLYGKVTGTCSICGRELTDPNSIAAGIGPVCAKKF